jgi:hypothetical protein
VPAERLYPHIELRIAEADSAPSRLAGGATGIRGLVVFVVLVAKPQLEPGSRRFATRGVCSREAGIRDRDEEAGLEQHPADGILVVSAGSPPADRDDRQPLVVAKPRRHFANRIDPPGCEVTGA